MGEVLPFPGSYKKYLDEEDSNCILEEDDVVWRCNCSSHLFFLTPDGAKCSNCGIITSDWVE